ncbi:MAG: DNA translocase FtsK [Anaerolineae bacterium]|nr:DNA translocase FtsK [Anaerolineae bacterium]
MAGGGKATFHSRLSRLADGLQDYQLEIVGLLVACWGLISLAAMLGLTGGVLVTGFNEGLFRAFGIGAPALALVQVLVGAVLLGRPMHLARGLGRRALGLAILWAASLMAAELAAPAERWTSSYGGGLGWLAAGSLRGLAGPAIGWLATAALAAEGVQLTVGFSWRRAFAALGRFLQAGARRAVAGVRRLVSASICGLRRLQVSAAPETPPVAPVAVPDSLAEEHQGEPASAEAADTVIEERVEEARPMPPLDLFDPPVRADGSGAEDAVRATIIEETLAGFGIPAKVVEVHRGPAVTRFGLKPGYVQRTTGGVPVRRRIRVNKIKALADDLALALAAAPIRVEAPIPGRPLVGIEVPNTAVSLVGIREILESPEYEGAGAPLPVALGKDISGRPFVVPLSRMPHLLIAGATGSGKSVCISAIVASLLFSCAPSELRLLLMDPKRVELVRYNGVPHLLGKVEVEVEGAIAALRWACKQMDERYATFAREGVRDLSGYNALPSVEPLPRIVIIIDELADLMLTSPDEVEKVICRLAQMARATGIHLVVATQRPSVDVVTGLIKANFPARISFAVTSQTDSRVILDTPGAESLIGHGDMLYLPPDSSKLHRLQGTFVSEEETRRLVDFWRQQADDGRRLPVAPWSGMLEEEEDHDELFDQAVAVAREVSAVSASYLQRRLRIGYPRAARLLDLLEEAGIVGEAAGGGKARPVLKEQDGSIEGEELEDLVEEEEAE